MDDDPQPPRKEYPLSPAKMSKTPSWIMLGFVLGALFVVALPPLRKNSVPAIEAVRRAEIVKPAAPRQPQPISTVEAVFEEWGSHAIWFDDTTEVALWNSAERDFTDYYEVRRFGKTNYFRSIPTLTRRIVSRGKLLPNSPLRFTETQEQYREWLEHGRTERPAEGELKPAQAQPPSATRVNIGQPPFKADVVPTFPRIEPGESSRPVAPGKQ